MGDACDNSLSAHKHNRGPGEHAGYSNDMKNDAVAVMLDLGLIAQ